MRRLFAAALLAIATTVLAQNTVPGTAAPEAPAKPPTPAARIAQVAWLTGYWIGEGLGGTIEDVWLPPRGGVLLGAFRLQKADGKPGFLQLSPSRKSTTRCNSS